MGSNRCAAALSPSIAEGGCAASPNPEQRVPNPEWRVPTTRLLPLDGGGGVGVKRFTLPFVPSRQGRGNGREPIEGGEHPTAEGGCATYPDPEQRVPNPEPFCVTLLHSCVALNLFQGLALDDTGC